MLLESRISHDASIVELNPGASPPELGEWCGLQCYYDGVCRTLKDPVYHVEQLFSSYQGQELLDTTFNFDTTYGQAQQYNITASTTCQDAGCTHLAVKVHLQLFH